MKTYKITVAGKEIDVLQNEDGSFNKPNIVKELESYGTALKPAFEPICMAMKPLSEKNYVSNVLKYGTGGINIDESRVEVSDNDKIEILSKANKQDTTNNIIKGFGNNTAQYGDWSMSKGRFPANLIHDNSEEVRECFPDTKKMVKEMTGEDIEDVLGNGYEEYECNDTGAGWFEKGGRGKRQKYTDNNTNASRFFKSIIYTAKASKSERNMGCEGLEDKVFYEMDNGHGNLGHFMVKKAGGEMGDTQMRKNNHPTVKPIALMEYLINMVTREGQTVLDPFAGSGTTLIAAKKLGRKYIGIELEPEYVKIAEARLRGVTPSML